MMHIYAFGSVCRGDISVDSDVDLLALVEGRDPRLNQDKFSIYSYIRINELWASGNAFAWHLALESKLIHAEDGTNYLENLGMPSDYNSGASDCRRFQDIFNSSLESFKNGTPSVVFELSTMFLAIRNIATCYSLARTETPTFGRDSARKLGHKSIPIGDQAYALLLRARILSTRGIGENIGELDLANVVTELEHCRLWVNELATEITNNG